MANIINPLVAKPVSAQGVISDMEEIIASGNYNFTPETMGEITAFLVKELNETGEVKKERVHEIIDLTVLVQRKL